MPPEEELDELDDELEEVLEEELEVELEEELVEELELLDEEVLELDEELLEELEELDELEDDPPSATQLIMVTFLSAPSPCKPNSVDWLGCKLPFHPASTAT